MLQLVSLLGMNFRCRNFGHFLTESCKYHATFQSEGVIILHLEITSDKIIGGLSKENVRFFKERLQKYLEDLFKVSTIH